MYNQEDDKIVEMQDFSNKKTESEGEKVDRNTIFEPRPDEDCKKETREPKEILISEINDLQMTLKDLMEKVENVNGDVKRLEIENEVNSVFFLPKLKSVHQNCRCYPTTSEI